MKENQQKKKEEEEQRRQVEERKRNKLKEKAVNKDITSKFKESKKPVQIVEEKFSLPKVSKSSSTTAATFNPNKQNGLAKSSTANELNHVGKVAGESK